MFHAHLGQTAIGGRYSRQRQTGSSSYSSCSFCSVCCCLNKNLSRTLACARYYYYRPHAGPGTAWRSHTSRVHIARGRPPAPATSGRCLELGRSVGGHAPPGGSRQRSACGATLPCVASQCHCLAEALLAVLGSPDIMRRILCFTGWIGHRSHISAGFDAGASVHRISMSSTRSGPEESMVFVNCATDVFLADINAHTTATIKHEKGETDFESSIRQACARTYDTKTCSPRVQFTLGS